MIVRSTHAARLTPKPALPSTCRKTRHCTIHSKPVCGLLRSSNFGTCRHRPSVQVAAQEVVSAGQVKPRFAKQLGLEKEADAAQEADIGGKEKPLQPRFAKQLGLLKEDKPDEHKRDKPDQQAEQLNVEQLDVEELDVEQLAEEELAPEPGPDQPQQGKDMHCSMLNAAMPSPSCCCVTLNDVQHIWCRGFGLGHKQGGIPGH